MITLTCCIDPTAKCSSCGKSPEPGSAFPMIETTNGCTTQYCERCANELMVQMSQTLGYGVLDPEPYPFTEMTDGATQQG